MRTYLLAVMLVVPLAGAQLPLPTLAPMPDLPEFTEGEPPEPEPCLDKWMYDLIQESKIPGPIQNRQLWRTMICDWADDVRNYTQAVVQSGTLGLPLAKVSYMGTPNVPYGGAFASAFKVENVGLLPIAVSVDEFSSSSIACMPHAEVADVLVAEPRSFELMPELWVQILDTLQMESKSSRFVHVHGTAPASTSLKPIECSFNLDVDAYSAVERESSTTTGAVAAFIPDGVPYLFGGVAGVDGWLQDEIEIALNLALPADLVSTEPYLTVGFEATGTFVESENEGYDHDYMVVRFSEGGNTALYHKQGSGAAQGLIAAPIEFASGTVANICISAEILDDEQLSRMDEPEVQAAGQKCRTMSYTQVAASEIPQSMTGCRVWGNVDTLLGKIVQCVSPLMEATGQ